MNRSGTPLPEESAGAGGRQGAMERGGANPVVDWAALHIAARAAARHAYAPYSGFPVGAAALVDDGRVVTGCNVESASYGLGLCAECSLVSDLHGTGGGRLLAVVCVDSAGKALPPCGRCRQLLWEHGGAALLVDTEAGPVSMGTLLPGAFSAALLPSDGSARRALAADEG